MPVAVAPESNKDAVRLPCRQLLLHLRHNDLLTNAPRAQQYDGLSTLHDQVTDAARKLDCQFEILEPRSTERPNIFQ
jgi:hypothetical protein